MIYCFFNIFYFVTFLGDILFCNVFGGYYIFWVTTKLDQIKNLTKLNKT
jgi:hypothetical protein